MRVSKEHVIFSMSSDNKAVARVASGTQVTFETLDCFSNTVTRPEDVVSRIDFNRVNPATGPLWVEGAEPGDTLKVSIQAIRLGRSGAVVTAPGLGQLADSIQKEETVICDVDNDHVYYRGFNIPLRKMIGVIGTAPADKAVNTGTPDTHGGNMDCTRISEGATLYLPVNTPGALLAMGDLHATMGDGEVMGSGLEIAGEVDVVVEVIKGRPYPLPFIETDTHVIAIASHEDVALAAQRAITNMTTFLTTHTDLSFNEAGMLLSLAGNVLACQLVNPKRTMRIELPRQFVDDKLCKGE